MIPARRTLAVSSLSLAFVAALALALASAQTGGTGGTGATPGSGTGSGQAAAADTDTLDGKQIFLAQNCNACHAVSTAGITAKAKTGGDLATAQLPSDTKQLGPFLRQKSDVDGKKHMKAFTGSDEELGAVIAWITEQQKQQKK